MLVALELQYRTNSMVAFPLHLPLASPSPSLSLSAPVLVVVLPLTLQLELRRCLHPAPLLLQAHLAPPRLLVQLREAIRRLQNLLLLHLHLHLLLTMPRRHLMPAQLLQQSRMRMLPKQWWQPVLSLVRLLQMQTRVTLLPPQPLHLQQRGRLLAVQTFVPNSSLRPKLDRSVLAQLLVLLLPVLPVLLPPLRDLGTEMEQPLPPPLHLH